MVLEHEQVARDGADAGRQRDRRQPGGLGLADAVEGGGDAALGGDDVGPALEQLRRQARPARRRAGRAAVRAIAAAAAG